MTVTARSEKIILNPSEVALPGFPEIDLHEGAIMVAEEGPDWGEQEVNQFKGEGLFGSPPIDKTWPSRVVTIPLVLGASGDYDAARIALQGAVAQINDEGGWLKREMIGGAYGEAGQKLYCDITKASLKLGHGTPQVINAIDPNAELVLECDPDFYGDVKTGTAHEFTGDGSFTEDIGGDMPARVVNMQVEDKSGNAQMGLMFHYRGRNYSSASTAEWAYDAEALGLLDLAEKAANPGGVAYGSKVVKHPKLSTEWTPVLSTNQGGTTFLTHAGLYLVWARVYSTSSDLPWLRLAYGAGDVVAPSELTQLRVPGGEGWYDLPLGLVNIPTLPFGAQRWEGVIQARGENGGENIYIDRLRFQCADECSGVLTAKKSATALASVLGSDSLITRNAEGKAEALNATEDTRGHKWEDAATGTGFEREAEGTTRKTKEETEGRTALLAGSTIGPVRVAAEFEHSAAAEGLTRGIYLRYFSATYFVRVTVEDTLISLGQVRGALNLEYREGGSVVTGPLLALSGTTAGFVGLEAEIDAAGEVTVRYADRVLSATLPATFRHGETHAEGKIGIYDYNPSATPSVRSIRYLVATPLPPSDAVMYANKSAYLSTNGMYRQSEDGLGASPIGYPGSDLPRLPVASPVEIAVHPSRGWFGETPDSAKDKFKVQMSYRECFAEVPGS